MLQNLNTEATKRKSRKSRENQRHHMQLQQLKEEKGCYFTVKTIKKELIVM